MLFHLLSQVLSQDNQSFSVIYVLGVLVLGVVLPLFIGSWLAKRWRLQDHGWKIGVILMTILLAAEVVGRTWNPETGRFDIKLGIDLKGGVILIYEVEPGVAVQSDSDATPPKSDDDESAGEDEETVRFSMGALVEALSRRINPSGTKEIVIRPYGDRQVEIIIPEVDQREVNQIKKTISTAGVLQFRIVANRRDHSDIIDLAEQMAKDPIKKRSRVVMDEEGIPVGLWARVAREEEPVDGIHPFKVDVSGFTVRDGSTGDFLEIPPSAVTGRTDDERRLQLTQYIESLGIKNIDVLMATDDGYDVNGAHLGMVSRGVDEVLNPCIHFNLKAEGVNLFAGLTGEYSPEGNFHRQLGIVLDNELISAPNIQERITGRGRITGQFTQEEVDRLVTILQAGSLPVILNKTPISENLINPLLGKETIEQATGAIKISLALVLLFILLYYRFAGFVACMALLTNLLLIVALMVMIDAALTLPGVAGLVLTVGMSVDANVLIFERIREELKRGASLRLAIRNGFSRATTTIVDANVTTLITALVLYGIGTDQIRGFAVTLILGILMSMYTAIFCSRVVFDIGERVRRMTKLNMTQLISESNIDFLGKRHIAVAVSILLICLGIAGIAVRGLDIFDIDFRGGTSVHLMLDKPAESEAVRAILDKKFKELEIHYTLTGMSSSPGQRTNQIFKVDSAIEEVDELERIIQEAFDENGGDIRLATYSLDQGPLRTITVASAIPTRPSDESAEDQPTGDASPESKPAGASQPVPPEPKESPAEQPAEAPADKPAEPEQPADADATEAKDAGSEEKAGGATSPDEATEEKKPAESKPESLSRMRVDQWPALAVADDVARLIAQAETESKAQKTTEPAEDGEATPAKEDAESSAPPKPSDEQAKDEADQAGQPARNELVEVPLKFAYGISHDTLFAEIEQAAKDLNIPISYFELLNPEWEGGTNAFNEWTLRIAATQGETKQLLDYLKDKFEHTPVWPSSSKIGSAVAGRMQNKAAMALLTSLLGIVIYIWIRFQKVVFGVAAVIALVHDVLITLGAIAVSAWLADYLGFLGIEAFKISLPIVAALLTIIGYSLNDTIVVFDRIREVRGKSPALTADMINRSINETLSRTLLTSFTTFIVVAILYAIGGEGIHGFAFSLVVGVIVGTYSSIFIASPTLLWMAGQKSPS